MKDVSLHLIDPNPFQPRLAEDPASIAALAKPTVAAETKGKKK